MTQALVTGGAGFIGSHVVDVLLQQGFDVAILDVLSTGRKENVHPKAKAFYMDLRSPDLGKVLREVRPARVFHLAAQSSVVVSTREPVLDADVNVVGTANLLRACVDANVEKVVFASSGGTVYGDPTILPCPEGHPLQPTSPYGASKVAGEMLLRAFHASYGLNTTALRLANIYGPRQDPNGEAGVIAIFGARMLKGQPVTIFGSGEAERDYVYAQDVARAFFLASNEPGMHEYNVGCGQGTSVNQLFEIMAKTVGYTMKPIHDAPRPGEVFKTALDSTRLQKQLNWRVQVPLAEGIRKTLDSLRG